MIKVKIDKKAVGKRIKSIRIEKGMTTAEFAKLFDPPASDSLVSRWERGVNLPNKSRLEKIANIGGYESVEELLYGKRNIIIKYALSHALDDFLNYSKQRKLDYKKHKDRYEALLNNLFEKYSEYEEVYLPTNELYVSIRSWAFEELDKEYLKGARNKESSLLYLRSILEDAHVTISKYEHDPLTQEAIKSGEIPQSVFRFVIHRLMDIKKELTNQLNEVNKQ